MQINPLGLCWYRGECYMFDMSTYSGPQSLTVPIYGYIMPILGRRLEDELQSSP